MIIPAGTMTRPGEIYWLWGRRTGIPAVLAHSNDA
jgi:hypothetical protein